MSRPDVGGLRRHDSWDGVRAVVVGLDAEGFAAADNLTHQGARVTVLDESDAGERLDRATLLEILGADVRLGRDATDDLPPDVDVVVAAADAVTAAGSLLARAAAREVPVWADAELAWRLRDPRHAAPWLAMTGTSGLARTVQMLDYVLRAHGLRSVACGLHGMPLVEAVMDPDPHDVIGVALSSAQLRHTRSMAARSAAVLDSGSPGTVADSASAEQVADTARVYARVARACVYNVADALTEQMVRDADVQEGALAVGLTLGTPAVGMVGVVDGILADRAFVEDRSTSAAELCTVADLASDSPGFVRSALAAAALARSHGVPPSAVRNGLRAFDPGDPTTP